MNICILFLKFYESHFLYKIFQKAIHLSLTMPDAVKNIPYAFQSVQHAINSPVKRMVKVTITSSYYLFCVSSSNLFAIASLAK